MDHSKLDIAVFGMGCFWSPDSLLSAQVGVIRTRVGYAGGTQENPTYTSIGSHTETVLIEFDSNQISYSELLKLFWDNHHYRTSGRKNQYSSRIFYTTENKEKKLKTQKLKKKKRRKLPLKFRS